MTTMPEHARRPEMPAEEGLAVGSRSSEGRAAGLLEPSDGLVEHRHRTGQYPGVPWDPWSALLAVLFIVVPIVELSVIIQVGQAFGALNTIALLLIVSVVGAWLVKREGMSVWTPVPAPGASRARCPGKEIADGVMILFAGALLMSPGFVTDILGILLLLPPVRAVIRRRAHEAGRPAGRDHQGAAVRCLTCRRAWPRPSARWSAASSPPTPAP